MISDRYIDQAVCNKADSKSLNCDMALTREVLIEYLFSFSPSTLFSFNAISEHCFDLSRNIIHTSDISRYDDEIYFRNQYYINSKNN